MFNSIPELSQAKLMDLEREARGTLRASQAARAVRQDRTGERTVRPWERLAGAWQRRPQKAASPGRV